MMSQVEIRAATVRDTGQILPLWDALVGNPEAVRFWERLGFATYMYRMKWTRAG